MRRIGIIGFGFSGNLVLANLVRAAAAPCEIYIIDPAITARGVAYSTPYSQHLLNVRVSNMSAWADDADDFARWLAQHYPTYSPNDFAPRMIYGEYLESIWIRTQELAAEKKLHLKLVPTRAVAITTRDGELHLLTERGDAIALDAAVLATGHEVKPVRPPFDAPVIQNPWAEGVLKQAAAQTGPIMLMGTGLTAVDVVLALRAEGYTGDIVAYSRNGLLPQPHREGMVGLAVSTPEIAAQHSLLQGLRWLRGKTKQADDWRVVVDSLRASTQAVWQKFTTREQKQFLHRLASFWNVHRHRMAPQIAQQIADEQIQGSLQIVTGRRLRAMELTPSCVINCTGPELNVQKSTQPLLQQLLANGMVEPHANGVGIAVDAQHRAWGESYPNLYAMGGLMTGQLLESTAVPELRAQAHMIAEALCK